MTEFIKTVDDLPRMLKEHRVDRSQAEAACYLLQSFHIIFREMFANCDQYDENWGDANGFGGEVSWSMIMPVLEALKDYVKDDIKYTDAFL